MPDPEVAQEQSQDQTQDQEVFHFPGVDEKPAAPEPEAKEEPEAKPTEDAKPPVETVEPAKEEPPPDEGEKVSVPKSEYERLQRQIKDKEAMIARQGTDVGEARKKAELALAALKNQMPADDEAERSRLVQLSLTDPLAFSDEMERIRGQKAQIAAQEAIIRDAVRIEDNRARLTQYVPDFESTLEDVAALIREDGGAPGDIEAFRANPYILDPAVSYNLHQRAKLTKQVAELTGQMEQLRQENAALRDRPDDVLRKIETVAATKPMTGNTGGATGKEEQIMFDPRNPFARPLRSARG